MAYAPHATLAEVAPGEGEELELNISVGGPEHMDEPGDEGLRGGRASKGLAGKVCVYVCGSLLMRAIIIVL